MENEVTEFAEGINAIDLKEILNDTQYSGLFKRRNYFLLNDNIYLIVKIGRNKIKPFWGLGEVFLDIFNTLTTSKGNYFFVALESNKSGWVFSKKEIQNLISSGLLSYSLSQGQYKINNYNLKERNRFFSISDFSRIIKAVPSN